MRLYEVLYVDFKGLWEVINGYDLVSRPVHSTALPSLRALYYKLFLIPVLLRYFMRLITNTEVNNHCTIPKYTKTDHKAK